MNRSLFLIAILTFAPCSVGFAPARAEFEDPGMHPEVVRFNQDSLRNRRTFNSFSAAESHALWELQDCMEVALRNSLSTLATRDYPSPQECEIVFDYDGTEVRDIEGNRFSKDPGFDYLAKKAVLGLSNDPTVKLPKLLLKRCFRVTARFYKSKEGFSVGVLVGELLLTGKGRSNSAQPNANITALKGDKESIEKNQSAKPLNGSLSAKQGKVLGRIDKAMRRTRNISTVQLREGNYANPSADADEESAMILGICSKYNHCSSKIVDQLHCYQLESLILRLKRQKSVLVQTKKIKQELKDLDADVLKLKLFGTKRRGVIRAMTLSE